MASPYDSLARGQYSSQDVFEEMQSCGHSRGQDMSALQRADYSSLGAVDFQPQDGYDGFPVPLPPGQDREQAATDAVFNAMDLNNDGKVSRQEYDAVMQRSAGGFTQSTATGGAYASGFASEPVKMQQMNADPRLLYEGAVEVIEGRPYTVNERLVDQRQQIVSGVRPIFVFEKVVEVPQIIVKETQREVMKPQMIERVIEVPKTESLERCVKGPTEVHYQEQIVEVPQIMVEERIKRVPRREIQERLIEVPKVEYVERIEYEDIVEYREVVVDKIIEVPEVEYHITEVEHLVPQNYVQDYFVDKYVEVPVAQMQEVAREELVPLVGQPYGISANTQHESWESRRSSMPMAQESHQGVEAAVAWNSYTGNSSNTQVLPPTTSGKYKQGIAVKVPRGTFGPPRTTMDGGSLFEVADRDRDGILTENEALSALTSVPWQQSVAMSQSNLRPPQSYREYDPGSRGGSGDYNPFTSGGAPMRSSFIPTPPGSAAALGSYATPHASSGGYGYGYGGASMLGTSAAPGYSSGRATPPTPPAWGGSSYDQAYRPPVTAY
eukprot:CAMPEP_0172810850 /NCGR_PEP_ID=MMETSP1075-20121228/9059_1 /TAXON_ID=2916 /ORGANISM="Ceratium fusus, Strain PA161109" /LENGTH=551 /DNA_ID=CAMNT_0013650217 /DNA_START=20 /DNA_END=1675 /DNA_ORIENTATION=-